MTDAMTDTALPDLPAAGNALEKRFKALAGDTRSADFAAFATDLQHWLRACIAQGCYLPAGTPERRTLQGQVDYWTSRMLQAGQGFDDIDRIAAFDPSAGRVLPDALFPYHGLLAASASNSVLFVGREEQTQHYADHLGSHAGLLIQSESGGGKSSVAMAGVLPELQRRHPDWRLLPKVTPGTRPADTLRAALAGLLGLPLLLGGDAAAATVAASLAAELGDDASARAAATAAASAAAANPAADAAAVQQALAGATLLVYIDQLEELLTMCSDVRQQAEFSELLAALADTGCLRLLATLRIDHYERLALSAACHPLFALLSRDGSVKTLPPLSLAQIRAVILKPAQAVGLRFVPASIVETLASETANAPSGLPLLQFALQRLWLERPRNAQGQPLDLVTDATYAQLPTLRKALSSIAQRYYHEMAQIGLAKACERLMLELTVIDERLEVPLRRRRAEAELLAVLVNAELASPAQAQQLIDGLVDRRLIVRTGDGDGRQIEVAHEALFRYWDLFQDLIKSDEVRATLRETRQISRDALLWQQGDRLPDLIKLRGEPLKVALRHRHAFWLDPLAADYVDACESAELANARRKAEAQHALQLEREAHAQQDAAAQQALQHERRARARNRRNFMAGAAVSLVVLLVAVGFALVTKQQAAKDSAASTNTVALLVPGLKSLDALDLAYTLQQSSAKASLAPLAHAIDRLGNGELLGRRDDGPAYFTPSGQAAFQLLSNPTGDLDKALIVPLDAGPSRWPAAVALALGLAPNETLAALDVGPPITNQPGQPDQRLVVVSVIDRASGGLKVLLYRIRRGSTDAPIRVATLKLPAGKTRSSDVAFDGSGQSLALTAWQSGPADSVLLRWPPPARDLLAASPPASDLLAAAPPTSDFLATTPRDGEARATAVAYAGPARNSLRLGLSDGSVSCGPGVRVATQDRSPVMALQAAAGSNHLVALHSSNLLSVVDCDRKQAFAAVGNGAIRPQNRALFANFTPGSDTPDSVALSYTLGGGLVCSRFGASGLTGACWGHDFPTHAALPYFEAGQAAGYRSLPDNAEPLMAYLDRAARDKQVASQPTPGLPVVRPTVDGRDLALVAASPDGLQSLGLVVPKATGRLSLLRQGRLVPVLNPERLAINNRGLAVVLGAVAADPADPANPADASRSAGQPAKVLIAVPPDGRARPGVAIRHDAACLKLSPDGSQVLVANDRADTQVLAIETLPARKVAAEALKRDLHGVSACAIGDGERATIVWVSRNGDVLRSAADKPGWLPVSERVAFRLGGAALDVSIDAGSRFVAVVGALRSANCSNGIEGHLLRIWDLEADPPEVPVASTCLPQQVLALGPLTLASDGWRLPVYEARGKGLARFDYPCRSCAVHDKRNEMVDRLLVQAAGFGAKKLQADRIKALYGIAP